MTHFKFYQTIRENLCLTAISPFSAFDQAWLSDCISKLYCIILSISRCIGQGCVCAGGGGGDGGGEQDKAMHQNYE